MLFNKHKIEIDIQHHLTQSHRGHAWIKEQLGQRNGKALEEFEDALMTLMDSRYYRIGENNGVLVSVQYVPIVFLAKQVMTEVRFNAANARHALMAHFKDGTFTIADRLMAYGSLATMNFPTVYALTRELFEDAMNLENNDDLGTFTPEFDIKQVGQYYLHRACLPVLWSKPCTKFETVSRAKTHIDIQSLVGCIELHEHDGHTPMVTIGPILPYSGLALEMSAAEAYMTAEALLQQYPCAEMEMRYQEHTSNSFVSYSLSLRDKHGQAVGPESCIGLPDSELDRVVQQLLQRAQHDHVQFRATLADVFH